MKVIASFFESGHWAVIPVKIIIIAVITLLIVKIIKHRSDKKSEETESLYNKLASRLIRLIVYFIGILLVVNQIPQLEKITQTLLAGSGVIALAVSLSAQESLNNVISGIFMTIFKPFKIGDRVKLVNNNITGTVEDITLRHTVIKTFVNSRIVVPNSTMSKEIIENSSLFDNKASSFIDVTITYEADLDNAIKIMASIIGKHPMYLDVRTQEEKRTEPKVKVYVRELTNNGIMLRANMWTDSVSTNFEACSDTRIQITKAFKQKGIEIPYIKYSTK